MAKRLEAAHCRCTIGQCTAVTRRDRCYLCSRAVRCPNQTGDQHEVVGCRRGHLADEFQHIAGSVQGIAEETAGDRRVHRVQTILEDAAIPKLPPPPRTAQNRSAFSSSLTRRVRPSAVTSCTDVRLSRARPYLPISHPIPPPRVRPAIPVLDTTPPVVASRCSWVSRLNSPGDAALRPGGPRLRIHVNAFHQRQVDHQPAINGGASRHVVTAAPHRDFQVQRARQMHRLDDIGDAAAARDQRGRLSTRPLWTFRASS